MVDATPFRQWFLKHYGIELGKKVEKDAAAPKAEEPKAEEPKK